MLHYVHIYILYNYSYQYDTRNERKNHFVIIKNPSLQLHRIHCILK